MRLANGKHLDSVIVFCKVKFPQIFRRCSCYFAPFTMAKFISHYFVLSTTWTSFSFPPLPFAFPFSSTPRPPSFVSLARTSTIPLFSHYRRILFYDFFFCLFLSQVVFLFFSVLFTAYYKFLKPLLCSILPSFALKFCQK